MMSIHSEKKQSSKTTAAACSRQTCEGCEIQDKLICIHTAKDVIEVGVIAIAYLIPFVVGMVIGKFWIGLAVWFGVVAFVGYLEVWVFCCHCPQYAEEGFFLNCHANWCLPKIHEFDPRPMNTIERVLWLISLPIRFLYYVPFFVVSGQWFLLGLTTCILIGGSWIWHRTQCARCSHLSCPINRVPEDVRKEFFKNYPEFAKGWKRDEQD